MFETNYLHHFLICHEILVFDIGDFIILAIPDVFVFVAGAPRSSQRNDSTMESSSSAHFSAVTTALSKDTCGPSNRAGSNGGKQKCPL